MTPAQIAVGCILTLSATFSAGWIASHKYYSPKAVIVTAHSESILLDGSHIAARLPETKPAPQTAVPRGRVVDSTTRIVLRARKPVPVKGADPVKAKDCAAILTCPAVTVQMTSVHDKSGPDQIIKTNGADIDHSEFHPAAFSLPPEHRNALGITYSTGQRYGVIFERMSGPVVLGVMAGQGADGKPEAGIMAAWRW